VADWLTPLFETIDRMDAQEFVSFLTENGSFRFGNGPAVSGRSQVQEAVAAFFSSVKGLSHRILDIWDQGDTVICEGEVTYTLHDGRELTLPFANIFRMEEGLVADYRIFADVSPLYS